MIRLATNWSAVLAHTIDAVDEVWNASVVNTIVHSNVKVTAIRHLPPFFKLFEIWKNLI